MILHTSYTYKSMAKRIPSYLVIYLRGDELKHKGFDTLELAKVSADHTGLVVGIFDYSQRKLMTDLIPNNGVYKGKLTDYIADNFPSEEELLKQKLRYRQSSQKVALFYFQKFALIFSIIVISGFCNFYLHWTIKPYISVSLAALFYGGSTLGYLVLWNVQTFGGKTPPERLNEGILIIGYMLGTAFTILSL